MTDMTNGILIGMFAMLCIQAVIVMLICWTAAKEMPNPSSPEDDDS